MWEGFSRRLGFAALQVYLFLLWDGDPKSFGVEAAGLPCDQVVEGGFELLSKAEFSSQVLGGVSTALVLSLMVLTLVPEQAGRPGEAAAVRTRLSGSREWPGWLLGEQPLVAPVWW